MILDGVSYFACIYLCKVTLSRMMNPTVVSLQSDPCWTRRVALFGTYVSRRLMKPTVLIQYVLRNLSNTLSPSLWRGCTNTLVSSSPRGP